MAARRAPADRPIVDRAEGHVVPRAQRIPPEVLVDHGDLRCHSPGRRSPQAVRSTVILPSLSDSSQPGQQVHQRRLPRAVGPHQGQRLTHRQVQVEVPVHTFAAARVAVADGLEADEPRGASRSALAAVLAPC